MNLLVVKIYRVARAFNMFCNTSFVGLDNLKALDRVSHHGIFQKSKFADYWVRYLVSFPNP